MSRSLGYVFLLVLTACAPTQARSVEVPAGDAHAELAQFLVERGYEAVPLQRLATGHFSIQAHTRAVPLTLIVDTGAGRTVFDRDWALQAGVALTEQETTASGLGGQASRWLWERFAT